MRSRQKGGNKREKAEIGRADRRQGHRGWTRYVERERRKVDSSGRKKVYIEVVKRRRILDKKTDWKGGQEKGMYK